MQPVIYMDHISKQYKTLNRREGLKGSLKDMFSKDYRYTTAVNDISLEIMPGEIVGYLGPNGAGKSSTIKIMTGIMQPDKGNIFVNGNVPYKKRTLNAQKIGVVFGQRTQLWWALPAIESFRILKDIYMIEDEAYREMLDFYATIVDISIIYHKPVRQLSLGQRILCDILAAFLHNPKVVFLDEPTIGLDVSMKAKIRELILVLNRKYETTILLTTHDISDVDALCQRVIIIDKGRKIFDNSIEQLKSYFGKTKTVSFMLKNGNQVLEGEEAEKYIGILKDKLNDQCLKQEGIEVITKKERIFCITDSDKCNIANVLSIVLENPYLEDIVIEDLSTEEVIRRIYEGGDDGF